MNPSPQVTLSVLLLSLSMLVAGWGAWARWRRVFTWGIVFFIAAGLHAGVSFLLAEPSAHLIWASETTADSYERAFLVVAMGLAACALGYHSILRLGLIRWRSAWNRMRTDDTRLLRSARWAVTLGITILVSVSAATGHVPLFSATPGVARFLSPDVSHHYRVFEWLINRGTELLICCLPLLLLPGREARRRVDWVLAFLGLSALLIPLRRVNFLTLLLVTGFCYFLRQPAVAYRRLVPFALVLVILVGAHVSSQAFFVSSMDGARVESIALLGSIVPEVRDLGWALDLLGGKRLHGRTLLQGLVPVPSFLSEFSQTSSLDVTTKRLVRTSATAGLRVTFAGEGYMNFGFPGIALVMLPFGILLGLVEAPRDDLIACPSIAPAYVSALAAVLLCVRIYLGGTAQFGTLKGTVLIVGAMLWYSRWQGVPYEDTSRPAGTL